MESPRATSIDYRATLVPFPSTGGHTHSHHLRNALKSFTPTSPYHNTLHAIQHHCMTAYHAVSTRICQACSIGPELPISRNTPRLARWYGPRPHPQQDLSHFLLVARLRHCRFGSGLRSLVVRRARGAGRAFTRGALLSSRLCGGMVCR
jgi:hypothetical protein